MYRVTLRVDRVPADVGPSAARDITAGFKHRPWQERAVCMYEGEGLTFTSENDFDKDGLATQDEFAHEFSASLPLFEADDSNLRIVSVEEFRRPSYG